MMQISNSFDVFCLNRIVDAIVKNSSRTTFGGNRGFISDLIFPEIVLPYSLKHPA
tara:strand:- start:719 stop:883 length:165 start_codon:yes stop_codon:yes gene_type:complete